jgi:hypothetical protein
VVVAHLVRVDRQGLAGLPASGHDLERFHRAARHPASGPSPITVGLDGGYLRSWDNKKTHFVAIVGDSVPRDGPAKRFGFVLGHDPKPGRHLAAVLDSQGLALEVGAVSTASDGGELESAAGLRLLGVDGNGCLVQ